MRGAVNRGQYSTLSLDEMAKAPERKSEAAARVVEMMKYCRMGGVMTTVSSKQWSVDPLDIPNSKGDAGVQHRCYVASVLRLFSDAGCTVLDVGGLASTYHGSSLVRALACGQGCILLSAQYVR